MAKTNKIVEEGVQTDYTSVIVSYSNGIDSTGALYWVLQEFPKEKIFLLYCDTGFEYPENVRMFYMTAALIGVRPVLLQLHGMYVYERSACSREYEALSGTNPAIHPGGD